MGPTWLFNHSMVWYHTIPKHVLYLYFVFSTSFSLVSYGSYCTSSFWIMTESYLGIDRKKHIKTTLLAGSGKCKAQTCKKILSPKNITNTKKNCFSTPYSRICRPSRGVDRFAHFASIFLAIEKRIFVSVQNSVEEPARTAHIIPSTF